MEKLRPIRTIHFQIQSKGGVGKSYLTYLLANKHRVETDAFFIDADAENKTSSSQNLTFLNGTSRLAFLSILDKENKIKRDLFTKMLERFGMDEFPYQKVFVDLGATESTQLLRLFSDDFDASILKIMEEKYRLRYVFNVVIAGNTAYTACVNFLEKVQQLFQENHTINIYANAEEFRDNYNQMENLKELAELHKLPLKVFGRTEKNSTVGNEITQMIQEGKSLDDYSDMFAYYQIDQETQLI